MIMITRLNLGFTVLFSVVIVACSSDNDKIFTPTNFTVNGKVEKGPFVRGSSMQMQPLDASLREIGEMYTSTIEDNLGSFTFGSKKFETQYAKLTASGYYFNEVRGKLSSGTLSMNAIANLSDAQTVNVNILTHLKFRRIISLVEKDGKSFNEANIQAQKELLSCFGLQKYAQTDATKFSITAGTDEAAALIAVSSLILYDRSEAEVTEYLSRLSSEFASSGKFSDISKKTMLSDMNAMKSSLDRIADNIVQRYEELGIEVSVKNLAYYFDWNQDGEAGNELAPKEKPISLEKTEISVPKEGGSYQVKINTTVPVYLEVQGENYPKQETNTDSYFKNLYEAGYENANVISYVGEIKDNALNLTVKKAGFRTEKSVVIPLYDGMGSVVAQLTLKQEGNPNISVQQPKLGEQGKGVVSSMAMLLSKAIGFYNGIDARYTGIINDPSFKVPVNDYNQNINNCWSSFYQTLNLNLNIVRADKAMEGFYIDNLSVFRAICYYNMVTLWGGVVYIPEERVDVGQFYPRASESDILINIESELINSISNLNEKKNVACAEDMNDLLFMSKDVARIALAYIYMYKQEWSKAKPLLYEVVSHSYYSLEEGTNYTASSKDLILGLWNENGTRNNGIMPIFTYTDVILSLAECEINTGNGLKGESYISSVNSANRLGISGNTIETIRQIRKEMKLPSYFAFLKRNNLAKKEMSLKDYQLLLPIPQQDIILNPFLIQNPGY